MVEHWFRVVHKTHFATVKIEKCVVHCSIETVQKKYAELLLFGKNGFMNFKFLPLVQKRNTYGVSFFIRWPQIFNQDI